MGRAKNRQRYPKGHPRAGQFISAGSGADIVVQGGPGNDRISVNGAPRKRGGGGGMGGGGRFGNLLPTRTVQEVVIEAGWDLCDGFLDGLSELAHSTDDVRSRAAAAYARAHTQPTRQGQRDEAQYKAGRDLAKLVGLVAVHKGLTLAHWLAMAPQELVALAQGEAAASSGGSVFTPDSEADMMAGALGGSIAADALELGGALLGSYFGPVGTAVGGLGGNLLGTYLGTKAGIAASNTVAPGSATQVVQQAQSDKAAEEIAAMFAQLGE